MVAALAVVVVYFLCLNLCLSSSTNSNNNMWQTAVSKIQDRQGHWNQHKVPLNRHTLIIYHIGDLGLAANSLDIATNNLKIFLGAVEMHGRNAHNKAFYLFNVVDDYNPLLSMIPFKRANVALLKWNNASSDLETHLRTLHLLGRNITSQFGSVIFSNQGVRGPLVKRHDGEWIGEFTHLLAANNVGLVGPTMSCEVSPHVQTHMFALRSSVIPHILSDMTAKLEATYKSWQLLISSLEVGLTGVVMNAGYNVSSFLYSSRGQPYFTHCLNYTGPASRFAKNPTGWCDVTAEDLRFVKWGGEPMRTPGMICNTTLFHMEDVLENLARNESRLELTVPEVMMGGIMYPLYKEYAQEAWLDRHPLPPPPSTSTAAPKSTVCFLVRVIAHQHAQLRYENANTALINKGIELLITTLRRQTDPHWLALFYPVDSSPSAEVVRHIISSFSDPRLIVATSVEAAVNGYSAIDAGYTATDRVLQDVLHNRQECRWVTVTTSDNSYGSEVVHNILTEASAAAGPVGMLVNPLDSRRFQEQDMLFQKQFIAQKETKLEEYCALLSNLQLTTLTFGVRSIPYVGSIDLAAVFFSAEKLVREKVSFSDFSDRTRYPCKSNITDPAGYPCLGSQGAHLISHLVQKRLWSYTRLPITGLRSVVFHGNSPTLCIGAGNVWVDHYDAAQQRCITPKDVLTMQDDPVLSQTYSFAHFFTQGQILGTCLRARQKMSSNFTSAVAPAATATARPGSRPTAQAEPGTAAPKSKKASSRRKGGNSKKPSVFLA